MSVRRPLVNTGRRQAVQPLLLLAALPVWLLLPQPTTGAASPAQGAGEIRITRLDPRFDALVPTNARLEKIAEGFDWIEGPLWNREGSYLLFSDIPNNAVYKWKEGEGVSLYLKPSGYTGTEPFTGREPGSNGLTYDGQGRLVLAQHGDRRIARLEPDGHRTILADRYQGKRLNSPNDLVFDSRGNLYFTDPPFGLPGTFDDRGKELELQGVYRLRPDGHLELLVGDLKAPNGVALSPDEKTLYVTDVDNARAAWHAYDLMPDGRLANGRVFYDAAEWKRAPFFGPDGIKVDREGNLFAARPGGLNVFAPDGTLLGTIETDGSTSNCAWGGDGSTLYITGGGALYRIELTTDGF